MEITPLGDSAVLIRVAENFENAPETALQQVLATQRRLAAAKIPGVVEVAPAYTTVALFYDPLSAVAEGTGRALNELKFLRQVATADRQWNH